MADPAGPPFESLADALAWLDAHIDFEQNMPRRRAWPTLDRIHALTALLGEPQDSIPSIHVTGTNGKGSTSAMATSLLLSMGLSVGTYTSPNLQTVAERIARNAEPIDDASFTEVLSELALIEPLLAERPTRFDLLTAAAFSWFATESVDAMVVEVGLGGTWDTTNVIHGDVAVLTNVSFDHTDVLGPTLEGIAADKAGIIEPESAVVLGDLPQDLRGIVEERAAEVGAASVWLYGRDYGVESNQVAVGGRLVTLWTPGGRYEDVLVPLHGAHQGVNAAVALAAVEAFFAGPLAEEVVAEGLAAVRVPGRLEVLGRRPLLLVDGAHNAAGMATLGDALNEEFAVDGTKVAVVGMLSGRDPSAMLAPLASAGVAAVVLCQPDSPRAMPLAAMAEAARALRLAVHEEPDVREALRLARAMVDGDGLVVVCGSLYVVGAARADALSSAVPWGTPDADHSVAALCNLDSPVDRTLVIVKPDGVERGLAGEIVSRLERKNLRLVAAELRTISKEVAQTHYAEHAERPFFSDLVTFITRSPSLIMVLEGPKDTYAVVRLMMGTTNPAEAAPGTIRGDLGIETTENLVHGSDSHESAAREIALFFPDLAAS